MKNRCCSLDFRRRAQAWCSQPTTQAATLTDNEASWIAAVGGNYDLSNSTLPDASPVTSVPLNDGVTLGLAGAADSIFVAGFDWINWANGYAGDVVDTTTNSETLSFPGAVSALGVELSPDIPLISDTNVPETFTVTLSDGITQQFSDTYDYTNGFLAGGAEPSQFVGFYDGGGITSMTISVTDGLPINPQTNQQAFPGSAQLRRRAGAGVAVACCSAGWLRPAPGAATRQGALAGGRSPHGSTTLSLIYMTPSCHGEFTRYADQQQAPCLDCTEPRCLSGRRRRRRRGDPPSPRHTALLLAGRGQAVGRGRGGRNRRPDRVVGAGRERGKQGPGLGPWRGSGRSASLPA